MGLLAGDLVHRVGLGDDVVELGRFTGMNKGEPDLAGGSGTRVSAEKIWGKL